MGATCWFLLSKLLNLPSLVLLALMTACSSSFPPALFLAGQYTTRKVLQRFSNCHVTGLPSVYGDPAIRYVHTYKGPTKAQSWPQWAQFALPSRGYSGILSFNCISPKEIQRVFRFWRQILICTWCVKGTWGGWHSLLVLLFLFQYFLYQLQFASFTILRVTALSLSPLTTHSVHSVYLSFFC